MKSAKEYWKDRFGEYPQNDAERLAVTMMMEYYHDITKGEVVKNISSNPVLADSLPLSEVAELLRWYKQLSPAQKCTVHPPAGSGGTHGIYNQTEEELIERWRKR